MNPSDLPLSDSPLGEAAGLSRGPSGEVPADSDPLSGGTGGWPASGHGSSGDGHPGDVRFGDLASPESGPGSDLLTDGPLGGAWVLVPRAVQQAPALSERIRAVGGVPIEAPVLTIEPGDDAALRAAVHELASGGFAAACLTSPNGVDALAAAIVDDERDARVLAGTPLVACVGSGTTARLWDRLRIRPDLVPDRATTQALAEAMPAGSGRVLLPRADIASPILPEVLTDKGYEPVEVVAYRTGRPPSLDPAVLDDLADGRVDLIAFGSSSTVRNFAHLVGDRAWRGQVVSIGPVTTQTCRELGIEVAIEAEEHDLDGLVEALVRLVGEDEDAS